MRNEYTNKIESFYSKEKRMPSYSDMMKLFGFKSKNAVYRLVKKLLDADLVAKDHLGRLMPPKFFGEIPMLGLIKAGFPSAVDEELHETMNLEDLLIEKKESTYMLEVDGDSMIEAHIEEGDMVIIEKTDKAKDGQIVVAQIDGEFTMKYLRKKGEEMWLEPAILHLAHT